MAISMVLLINLLFHGYLLLHSDCLKKLSIKPPKSNKNILAPIVEDIATKKTAKFIGSCLIQNQITYTPQTLVNIYIFYEITKNNHVSSYSRLKNCLLVADKLPKNSNIDNYKYFGYDIGFDRKEQF